MWQIHSPTAFNHSISDGCQHDVIYLNFRKAFDSVPHNNLLAICKLWSFGITGKLWQWFRSYRISRNIDSGFNLAIWQTHQDRQINLRHYQSIYTTSISFSLHRTEIRQFKILPTVFSEQTAKYNGRQYFCLHGI